MVVGTFPSPSAAGRANCRSRRVQLQRSHVRTCRPDARPGAGRAGRLHHRESGRPGLPAARAGWSPRWMLPAIFLRPVPLVPVLL